MTFIIEFFTEHIYADTLSLRYETLMLDLQLDELIVDVVSVVVLVTVTSVSCFMFL